MKANSFLLLLWIFFLIGCSTPSTPKPEKTPEIENISFVNHEQPDIKLDFSPFEKAGCSSNGSGKWYECSSKSPLFKLGCNSIIREPFLGGITPSYPIVGCYRMLTEFTSDDECIEIEDRLAWVACYQYVIFKEGNYQILRNMDEIRAAFAPVDSSEEALAFALLSNSDYSVQYGQTRKDNFVYYVQKIEDTYVETDSKGYIVHLFETRTIGCGPFDTNAVEVKVSRDGQVEEVSRFPVYRDPSEDGLCVD